MLTARKEALSLSRRQWENKANAVSDLTIARVFVQVKGLGADGSYKLVLAHSDPGQCEMATPLSCMACL